MRRCRWLVAAVLWLAPATIVAAPAAVRSSPTIVFGVVFEDQNGTGRREPGEPGIADAWISDQITLAPSAADGSYRLAVSADSPGLVFVVPPTGLRRPGPNAGRADGPNWYRRVDELPEAAAGERRWDVPLLPWEVREPFRFAHLSDPHVDEVSAPRLEAALAEASRLGAAFVVVTGDLVQDALRVGEWTARPLYERYVSIVNSTALPVFSIPGNHEIFGIERALSLVSKDHPLYGKRMYRHYLGPTYYSANVGTLHLVALDTVMHGDVLYRGELDGPQLRWLAADLANAPTGAPVVPAMHIPLVSPSVGLMEYQPEGLLRSTVWVDGRYQHRHVVANADAALQLLRRHPVPLLLGGHFHKHERIQFSDGVHDVRFENAPAVVGEDETRGLTFPSGFLLFEVDGGAIGPSRFVPLDR